MPAPTIQVISATHRRGAEVYALDLRDALVGLGYPMELVALVSGTGTDRLEVEALATNRHRAVVPLRRRVRASSGVLAHGGATLLGTTIATAGTGVPVVYRSIGDPRWWSHRLSRRYRVGAQLRRVSAVVTTYPGAAATLVADYGLAPDRVQVIPNARPAARFPEPDPDQRRAARDALLPGVEGPVLAFVGSLSAEKDPVLAVAATAQLADVHLVVVGAGPLASTVAAYADAVAPGRVHLVGALPDPRPAYLAADALVLPSRTEGFPGVAIEAGLCAVPVVATDVGGVREVVIDGATGRVVTAPSPVRLAEALRSVLAERDVLGTAARAHCLDSFTMEAVAPRWARIVDRYLR